MTDRKRPHRSFAPAVSVAAWLVAGAGSGVGGCQESTRMSTIDPASSVASGYSSEVEAWHAERMARLREPDGWLTLVGLQWLEDGINVIECASFPGGRIGVIERGDGALHFRPDDGATVDGVPADGRLASDADGAPTRLRAGSVTFFVIERAGRHAVRLRDSAAPARTSFPDIERFPVDPAWRVTATFEAMAPTDVPITLVIGETEPMTAVGRAHWTHDGTTHALLLLEGGAPNAYFLVFGDTTNGRATYGAGRFLAVTRENDAATVELDFNRAYNPPCSLTPFATCPIPPAENRLPFEIPAGERAPAPFSTDSAHELRSSAHMPEIMP